MSDLATLKERADAARAVSHELFRKAGYRESPVSVLDHGDRLWHRRLDVSDMQVHFEEYGWDASPIPATFRRDIRPGMEVTYTVNIWSNTPHLRFSIHSYRVATEMDILYAEEQVKKLVKAFGLTRQHNLQGDGMDQAVSFIVVSPPKMGDRTAVLRMPLLRMKCVDLCPEMLDQLEANRGHWTDVYEVRFGLKIPVASQPGLNISSIAVGKTEGSYVLKDRIDLISLAPHDKDSDDEVTFPDLKGSHDFLRDEIETELARLERRVALGE